MTKHIFVHERKHPSGQEDNDFQVFIETDDDEAFPQPEGAHEYFYVGEKDDMPHGFERLAYVYDGSHGHNDAEFMERASKNFTITPSQKLANVSNSPQTHQQSDTGEIIQVPVKQAEIELRTMTDAELGRRISAAMRTIYAKLGALSGYEFVGSASASRKKTGMGTYEATHLQAKYIAFLAMAIHRRYFTKWTHSDTDAGDVRALLTYLEGDYQDIEAIWARNLTLPSKNIADWTGAHPSHFATDVVTTGGAFISVPNGVAITQKASNSKSFSLLAGRWDALRPTETWAADALT